MDFAETPEQQMVQEAVSGIAAGFGEAYLREKARNGGKTTELWDAEEGSDHAHLASLKILQESHRAARAAIRDKPHPYP